MPTHRSVVVVVRAWREGGSVRARVTIGAETVRPVSHVVESPASIAALVAQTVEALLEDNGPETVQQR